MSEQSPTASRSNSPASNPAPASANILTLALTASLIPWLVVQVAALALAVARVPLWARMPPGSELWALHYVMVVQVGISAMLFPWLMRSRTSAIAVIATAWPFIFLAGVLSPLPLKMVMAAAAYVTMWLAALWLLRSPLSSTGMQLTIVAAAGLWAWGGPILIFLHLEYAPDPQIMTDHMRLAMGPIMGAAWLLEGKTALALAIAGVSLAVAGAASALRVRLLRRRPATARH